MNTENIPQQLINLKEGREFRCSIAGSFRPFIIELVEGAAEIFGTQMILHKCYKLSTSFTVVSWHGCVLRLTGEVYKSFTTYSNNRIQSLIKSLETKRQTAAVSNSVGPIIIVVGGTDTGKSTLTRTILNNAAQSGWKPVYIDLDVGQSSLSIPGTLSITSVEKPEDIEMGFNEKNSNVYYFGYKAPALNLHLYFSLIKQLGKSLRSHFAECKEKFYSGAVIDTCGWVEGAGYEIIKLAIDVFQVNTLIVLDDESLLSRLEQELLKDINIVFQERLSGVVIRNTKVRIKRRDTLIREYFYGKNNVFKPFTFELNFKDINVFKVQNYSDTSSSSDSYSELTLLPVTTSKEIEHQVLAVSYAENIEEIILTCVYGFICILNVNSNNETVTVLSPCPAPLPNKYLLMGDLQFIKPFKG